MQRKHASLTLTKRFLGIMDQQMEQRVAELEQALQLERAKARNNKDIVLYEMAVAESRPCLPCPYLIFTLLSSFVLQAEEASISYTLAAQVMVLKVVHLGFSDTVLQSLALMQLLLLCACHHRGMRQISRAGKPSAKR